MNVIQSSGVSALVLSLLTTTTPFAADLSTIDRVIKKEPAYRSGKPKYCLLVFGQGSALAPFITGRPLPASLIFCARRLMIVLHC